MINDIKTSESDLGLASHNGTSIFLEDLDIFLLEDSDVIPVVVNCTGFVETKMKGHISYLIHPEHCKNNQLKKWPTHTDAWCLNDSHPFSTIPIPIPRKYDGIRNLYYVFGNFCSVNCAKTYIIEHEPNISSHRMLLFNQMIRRVFNIHQPVKPAPPRYRLKAYLGDLDILSYRNNFTHITSIILEPPFLPSTIIIANKAKEVRITNKVLFSHKTPSVLAPPTPTSSPVSKPINPSLLIDESTTSAIVGHEKTSQGLYHKFLERKQKETVSILPPPTPPPTPTSTTNRNKPVPLKRKKIDPNPKQTRGTLNNFITFQ